MWLAGATRFDHRRRNSYLLGEARILAKDNVPAALPHHRTPLEVVIVAVLVVRPLAAVRVARAVRPPGPAVGFGADGRIAAGAVKFARVRADAPARGGEEAVGVEPEEAGRRVRRARQLPPILARAALEGGELLSALTRPRPRALPRQLASRARLEPALILVLKLL